MSNPSSPRRFWFDLDERVTKLEKLCQNINLTSNVVRKFIDESLNDCENTLKSLELNELQTLQYENRDLKLQLENANWRIYNLERSKDVLQRKIRELEYTIESYKEPKKPDFEECATIECVVNNIEQNLISTLENDKTPDKNPNWEEKYLKDLECQKKLRLTHPELLNTIHMQQEEFIYEKIYNIR